MGDRRRYAGLAAAGMRPSGAGLRRRGGLESVSAGEKRAGDAAAAAAVHGLCAVAGPVERIAQFPAGPLSAPQRRLLQVLLDEMHAASRAPLQLPLPQDTRLLNIARALLNDPASLRSQCDWAARAGLSPRTLSRRFLQETGISFALWRQQARVLRSLEGLSRGEAVSEVAGACGYDNVSAYIAAFRRRFGVTPGRTLRRLGKRNKKTGAQRPKRRKGYFTVSRGSTARICSTTRCGSAAPSIT